jgi:cytidylate kinase
VKNKLTDLHNHLFEQLERLADDDLDLDKEIKRAKAMCGVAATIIANGRLAKEAMGLAAEYPELGKKMPLLLE